MNVGEQRMPVSRGLHLRLTIHPGFFVSLIELGDYIYGPEDTP
jgi:hypothetical protein